MSRIQNNLDLQTPCLLLDRSRFDHNLERLHKISRSRQLAFRPHLKTAKSPDITRICARQFGNRAMVSTLREAEMLRNCGIRDFLYSVAIVPGKFEHASSLDKQHCRLTVTVDNPDTAKALAIFCQQNDSRLRATIEIDLDGHRSGVSFDDERALREIGSILDSQGILRGVMSHAGESYALSRKADLQDCARKEAEKTLHAANLLISAGLPCELLSIGSTPTAISGDPCQGINELRAGVFMFFDLVQSGVGVCTLNEIALSVLTSVISCNPDKNSLVVDAGWMALSRDRGTSGQAIDFGYGQVCDVNGKIMDGLIVVNAQQEHGMIGVRSGSTTAVPELPPGTLLRILPNHACATAAQHNGYHVVSNAGDVIDYWPRFNGW